jgi:hypothetical protein
MRESRGEMVGRILEAALAEDASWPARVDACTRRRLFAELGRA